MVANSFALEYEPSWRRADMYPITTLKISSFAIKDYSKLRGKNKTPVDLAPAVDIKNGFFSYMEESYKKRYPKYVAKKYNDWDNADATADRFQGTPLYHSNIVFFAGHGAQQTLPFYERRIEVGEKAFGGDIKWVFLDACEVLNVNKDGKLDKGSAKTYWDMSKYERLKEAFIGVHAILGYYSKQEMIGGDVPSKLKYKYFAEYFIEDDMPIWEAYKKANKKYYDEIKDIYYNAFKEEFGYEPAIAYIKGTDQYGRQHDASTEKISSTYEVAMDPRNLKNQKKLKYDVLILSQKYGTPKY